MNGERKKIEELKKLHSNVERLKGSSRIGLKYMNMQEVIKYKVLDAVEEAVEENTKVVTEKTEQRMASLTGMLLSEKRYEDLERMSKDKGYRKKLFEEYGI